MNILWEQMLQILNQMIELYQAILDLSRKKRDVLVSGKAQDLEAVTKQEEALILQAGRLDRLREALADKIAAAHSLSANQATLRTIRQLADDETAARLHEAETRLTQLLKELGAMNKRNLALIQQGLSFVNYNLNLLARSEAELTYAPPQGTSTSSNSSGRALFDRKA